MKLKNKTGRNNRFRFLRAPDDQGGDGTNGGAPDSLIPPAGDPPPDGGTPPPGDGVTPPGDGGDPHAWLPEKFRVMGEDGKLDEAASSRKLADSYRALEAHKGAIPSVPATPADYRFESPKDTEGKALFEDQELADFTGDPLFKGFAERAHGAKLTNEQLQFVIGEYLTVAPQLLEANTKLTYEEARAELQTLWPDDKAMSTNLAAMRRAIDGYGGEAADAPGSVQRLVAKYGRDPDFIAFAARIGAEMKEDTVPNSLTVPSDVDVDALMKGPAYWDKHHPDHTRVKAQVDAYHAQKYGTQKRR